MKLILDETQPNVARVKIGCGELFIIIGWDGEKIRFFFLTSHNGGGCEANLTALAKAATLFYNDRRFSREKLIQEWKEVSCDKVQRMIGGMLNEGKEIKEIPKSCADAIARVLAELEIREQKK